MAVDPAEIVLEDGPSKGRYVYRGAGAEAELTFSKAGALRLIIDHTEVPDARASGRRILPLCPFAAAQFRKHPDWADVLDRPD